MPLRVSACAITEFELYAADPGFVSTP